MQHLQSFLHTLLSLRCWKSTQIPGAHELDPFVLNVGLGLAVSNQGHWCLPIQSGLSESYPEMGSEELDGYNEVCQSIIQTGITLAHQPKKYPRYRTILPVSRTETQSWMNYQQGMQHHYPWISDSNLYAIFCFAQLVRRTSPQLSDQLTLQTA